MLNPLSRLLAAALTCAVLTCPAPAAPLGARFLFSDVFTSTLSVSTASAGTIFLSTADNQFDPGVDNQGWWSSSTGNQDNNTNYFTGFRGPDELRSFFSFDLSALAGQTVTAMVFNITSGNSAGPASETFNIFDVTTDATTLNANDVFNPAIFADLGSGTSYGSFLVNTPSGTVNNLALNSNAVADLNKALTGGATFFSLGGALDSAAVGPSGVPEVNAQSAAAPLAVACLMLLFACDRRKSSARQILA